MPDEREKEIELAEGSWRPLPPDVTKEQLPEQTMAVRAHNLLADKIQLADEIAKECVRLQMTGVVTKDNYTKAKTIVKMCVEARGNIKRNKEDANRDAIDWQKAINKRAGELIDEVWSIEEPYYNGIKAIDEEKAEAKRKKEEAERKAIEDANRAKIEAEHAAEKKKLAAEAAEKQKRLQEQADAARKEADALAAKLKEANDAAAKHKAVNDELAALKKQMAAISAPPEVAKAIVDAPDGKLIAIDEASTMPTPNEPKTAADVKPIVDETIRNYQANEASGKPPNLLSAVSTIMSGGLRVRSDSPKEVFRFSPPVAPEIKTDGDLVRLYGEFIAALVPPVCADQKAKIAVELAQFDLLEIAKPLREWKTP